jgi:hypothetical protein
MPLDLNAAILQNNAGALQFISGATQIGRMSSGGILQRYAPTQTMFRAGEQGTAGNVTLGVTVNTWMTMVLSTTNVNTSSCYNPATGTFTAPITAMYMFAASVYITGAGAGWYCQCSFWVNGSQAVRKPSVAGDVRIRAHGYAAGYTCDDDMHDILFLNAGDYVNCKQFIGGTANNTYVPQYSRFEGYLL